MTNLIGRQLDNYRIDALLGEGGMGSVYRAYDVNLARPVALKVMHPQFANQAVFRQRFLQEAQAAARLSDHASIVNIYDFGLEANHLFMVMEYVPGASLGAFIKRLQEQNQVVKLSESLLILAQVADALGYAHRRGVVHRDVKPDNVLLRPLDEPDRPGELPIRAVVTDFGLAKLIEGGLQTQTGTFMGTLPYMSPEQCMGRELDGRSDIYALGVILYQLSTGQLPFDIKSPTDAVMKHMNAIPPNPTDVRPGLPPSIEFVIKKAIAKAPADRFQKGEDMAADLRQAAARLTDQDVTQFAQHQSVVSLATQFLPANYVADPSRLGFDMTAMPGHDRLLIAQSGESPRSMTLDQERYTIGRGNQNSLVLTGEGVSRNHLRLERSGGGWQIIDLGSTNGTFVDGNQLLPDVAQRWEPGQALGLGPYILHLQLADQPVAPTGMAAAAPILPTNLATLQPPVMADHMAGRFSIDMRPMRLESGGICRVLINNESNSPMSFGVFGRDEAGMLTFASVDNPAAPASLTVGPGGRDTIDLQVGAKDRPLLGGSKAVSFEIQVRPSNGQQQVISGVVDVKPVLPGWLVPLLAILLLILCLTGGGLLSFFNSQNARATQTAEASTATFVAASGTEETLDGIAAQETAVAMQATSVAATATADEAVRLGDDDNDGLSNSQEETIGTDPDVADSDNDGLLDGEEFNQYGTDPLKPDTEDDGLSDGDEINVYQTSPTNVDTDSDGLTDGDEVNIYGTLPTEPDTDGDGFSDADEVEGGTDPLDSADPAPTATITPTPTPTFTPTPTPTPTVTPVVSEPTKLVYANNQGLFVMTLELEDGILQPGTTNKLADGDGISSIKISPDGEKVAFQQILIGNNNQLLVVGMDGSGLESIADSGTLSLSPVPGADPEFTRRIVGEYQWLSDSERLAYNSYTVGTQGPGLQFNGDLFVSNLEGDMLVEHDPDSVGGTFDISNQDQVVMATTTEVLRMDLDGSNLETLITFPGVATYSEYAYYPEPRWLPNGNTAFVTISGPDPFFEDQIATYWQIPTTGAAEELNTVEGIFLMDHIYPSPDGSRTAFVQLISNPGNPPRELMIGNGQAGNLATYDDPWAQIEFYGWSADSSSFLYRSQNNGNVFRYHVGQIGESPIVSSVPGSQTALNLKWATNETFVLAIGSGNDWDVTAANFDGDEQLLINLPTGDPVFDVWTPASSFNSQ